MKKFLSIMLIIVGNSLNAYAYLSHQITQSAIIQQNIDDNAVFEIKNKTKKPILLSLIQDEEYLLKNKTVAASKGSQEKDHGYVRSLNDALTITRPTKIIISDTEENNLHSCSIISNKKIYLTYEGNKIRAQSGTKGKTQSGLSLKQAAIDKDISCIKPTGKADEEDTFIASNNPGSYWQIEIKNKTSQTLDITLESRYRLLKSTRLAQSQGIQEKDHGYVRFSGIDPREQIVLTIGADNSAPSSFKLEQNEKRETIYLTIEPQKNGGFIARPQMGTGIFTKKTQSGLPLNKANITEQEIKELRERPASFEVENLD